MNPEAEAYQSARTSSDIRTAVLGNCQMGLVARSLQALLGGNWPTNEWINFDVLGQMADGRRDLATWFDQHDKLFLQPWVWNGLKSRYAHFEHKVVLYPNIDFLAFHPDLIYVTKASDGSLFAGPCGHYHSSLVLLAWKIGLSTDDAIKLYNGDIYRRLGFFDYWQASCDALRAEGEACHLPIDSLLKGWIDRGCFMHSVNHPKLFVLVDIVAELLKRLGITIQTDTVPFIRDYLADSFVWPVYPEIAKTLRVPGSYRFKLSSPGMVPDQPVRVLDLEQFVTFSYAAFSQHAPQELVCSRLDFPFYQQLRSELERSGVDAVLRGFESGTSPNSPYSAVTSDHKISADAVDLARLEEARLLFKPESAFWRSAA